MQDEAQRTTVGADELRRIVPAFAFAVTAVAPLADPASALDIALTALPVLAYMLWAFTRLDSLPALALAVVVPVVVGQRSGGLEPVMFTVSILAFVVARWARSAAEAVALGALALATPFVVAAVQGHNGVAVGIWALGIAFPWAIGRAVLHQARLSAQLEQTRQRLAERELLEERRRIARDVHDFVGHGLAAMMLQVTSARHVLRRDPQEAEDALRQAEEVGRLSMQELRRTVALLRSDDQTAVEAPEPVASAAEIPELIRRAQAAGLAVEERVNGPVTERIPAAVGAVAYRIAQEALANAIRHAPRARTRVELTAQASSLVLVVDSCGPVAPAPLPPDDRPRFGLIGMRERATAVGGSCDAGPTPEGWRVHCRLPLAGNGAGA